MKHLVILLGDPGAGKTTIISGPRARGKKLGETHQDFDCLMSRVPWQEGPRMLRLVDGTIKAGTTRVVELGRRPVAYLWSFDGGAWNEAGRYHTLRDAFTRYDTVLTDSKMLPTVPSGHRVLSSLIAEGVAVTCPIVRGPSRFDQRAGNAKRDWGQEGWASLDRTRDRLDEIGAYVATLATPHVDGLIELLASLR